MFLGENFVSYKKMLTFAAQLIDSLIYKPKFIDI